MFEGKKSKTFCSVPSVLRQQLFAFETVREINDPFMQTEFTYPPPTHGTGFVPFG